MRADLGPCKEEGEVEHAKGAVGARAAVMLPTLKTAINFGKKNQSSELEAVCESSVDGQKRGGKVWQWRTSEIFEEVGSG